MSARKYVSMSRERQFNLPAISNTFFQSDIATSFDFSKELDFGCTAFTRLAEYVGASGESEESPELDESFDSVFEAGTPGVMTLKQVQEEVDLDTWGLKLGEIIIALQVSFEG